MCSIWAVWIGPWIPDHKIYRHSTGTAQAQHAGTAPLDVGLRQFEFTAMEMVGKSDRQCRLLVQASNLHCCYLSPRAAERPICDTSSRRWKVRSHLSPHRVASHRIASHGTTRSRSGK